MKAVRIVFWSLFLPAAIVAGVLFWRHGALQRANRCLHLLTHPNAAVAGQAWWDLRELYFTKWAVYEFCLQHVGDKEEIGFLVEREKGAGRGGPEQSDFTVKGHPIYYRTDRVYCRTVGEAILAIVHSERKWKTDFEGDWPAWWEQNRGFYGKP